MQQLPDPDISNLGVIISSIKQTKKHTKNCIVCFRMVSIYNQEKVETLSPNLLSFVGARMFSTTDSGEKGYKLLEQILFSSLTLFPTQLVRTLGTKIG